MNYVTAWMHLNVWILPRFSLVVFPACIAFHHNYTVFRPFILQSMYLCIMFIYLWSVFLHILHVCLVSVSVQALFILTEGTQPACCLSVCQDILSCLQLWQMKALEKISSYMKTTEFLYVITDSLFYLFYKKQF